MAERGEMDRRFSTLRSVVQGWQQLGSNEQPMTYTFCLFSVLVPLLLSVPFALSGFQQLSIEFENAHIVRSLFEFHSLDGKN